MIQIKIPPAAIALGAALLFGASMPAAKLLTGQLSPQLLAGALYLGSGLGLMCVRFISRLKAETNRESSLKKSDLPWLVSAVLFGGVAGPLLLMYGLTGTSGGAASLLLNLESVFTALLAWFAFKENFDRRILIGMIAIVAGSVALVWTPGAISNVSIGSLAIAGACFCWAMDNNLTRNISDADPMQIASIKGFAAGVVNVGIALVLGSSLPSAWILLEAAIVGFFGYGLSLVLFIRSLRLLGSARTGAYFSTAPFSGTTLSILFLHDPVNGNLLIAAALMAVGVWLHVTESHQHSHSHSQEEHEHLHWHDEHHQHEHKPGAPAGEPHSHWHRHEAVTHAHPHYPDTHHRHEH